MKPKKFEVPSILEVEDYFNIKVCYVKNEVSKFWFYYQSNGWYVGRTKMRSWRAAASGWILRMEQFNKPVDTMIPGPPKMPIRERPSPKVQADIDQVLRGYERLKLIKN